MTRKKLGIGLLEAFSEPCEACASRGVIVHHEPIMRSKHVGEDPRPPKQNSKSKNRDKKQETPKVVTGERAAEVGNALTKIAASTLAAHEAAGETSPIVAAVAPAENSVSGQPNELLESVLDALPEPKAHGQGRRRPRSRRGSSGK
jgi:ribonuclease E